MHRFQRRCQQQLPQQIGQLVSLACVQTGNQLLRAVEAGNNCFIDQLKASSSEMDQDPPAVARICDALDQTPFLQPIDPVGHRTGGQNSCASQRGGRHGKWLSLAPQRGEHIEAPGVQSKWSESLPQTICDVLAETVDPGQDGQRRRVEIGPLLSPLNNDLVDLVSHGVGS